MMHPPIANATLAPMLRAPDAVPRITLIGPTARTTSISVAVHPLTPGPGSVAPRCPSQESATCHFPRGPAYVPAIPPGLGRGV